MASQAAPLPAKPVLTPARAPLAELLVNTFYDLPIYQRKKRGRKPKDRKERGAGYTEQPDVMRLERSYSRRQQIRVLDYLMFHRVNCDGVWKRRRVEEDKYELVSTAEARS